MRTNCSSVSVPGCDIGGVTRSLICAAEGEKLNPQAGGVQADDSATAFQGLCCAMLLLQLQRSFRCTGPPCWWEQKITRPCFKVLNNQVWLTGLYFSKSQFLLLCLGKSNLVTLTQITGEAFISVFGDDLSGAEAKAKLVPYTQDVK